MPTNQTRGTIKFPERGATAMTQQMIQQIREYTHFVADVSRSVQAIDAEHTRINRLQDESEGIQNLKKHIDIL